jgi:quercetin dioxygenase-like cupin family protein
MNTTRFAGGMLAAAIVATATACAGSAKPTTHTVRVNTASAPPSETLSPLFQSALPNVKGKTFTSAIVDFPPAARAVPHRHGQAFVYAYVLDGSVASKLEGEPTRTYHQGENWVEQPGAHHVLTQNPSRNAPAKLLVVFISNAGDKLKIDDHPK